ncbi:MAG: precorrin-6y C5,15-methyltransferase (decarboxylating) subunit CbiE [Deltaproteobacteria bacterium]|nr:precorrin-6y C5,15-methyltransferase (decarboxylating) subunit CbiE [Deltaproteobacteria bacterium]
MTPRVHVIGVPPGATEITADAREAALGARFLVGAARHLALVPDFGGEVWPVEARVLAAVDRVAADPALTAAFLASGDPGFFGIGATLLRRLPRDQVRLWPAVTSLQLAFARAGEAWSEARFASLHGRPLEALAPLLGASKIGLLTDETHGPAAVARLLLASGWDDIEIVVAEDVGLPSERITRGAPADFMEWTGSALNVVLLLRSGPDPRPLGPGLREEAFSHGRGLITKAEVRTSVLAQLRLPREGVLWDVGAGSGSVAVEACLLAPGLRAYAVEKTAEGQGHLAENRRRFRVAGLVPVAGEAPEALAGLPSPDAVFVGGSGGRLAEVLDACWPQLRPGGAMVVAAVLVETLAEALAWGRAAGIDPDLTEIRAARSRAVAGKHLMDPQNPVTLIRLPKPAEVTEDSRDDP